jgi:hypothetical protein
VSRKPTVDEMASAVWIAHGLVMNGGVLHAVEVLAPEELRIATAGYRHFGLPGAANAFADARKLAESARAAEEGRLDRAYVTALPDDAFLSSVMDRADPPAVVESSKGQGLGAEDVIARAIAEFSEWSKESKRLSMVPGKTRLQHRAADRVTAAVRNLLAVWDSGGHVGFLGLLDHGDDEVRASAAAFLVESDPDKAIPVIEAIDDGPPSPARLTTLGVRHALRLGNYRPLTRLRAQESPEQDSTN